MGGHSLRLCFFLNFFKLCLFYPRECRSSGRWRVVFASGALDVEPARTCARFPAHPRSSFDMNLLIVQELARCDFEFSTGSTVRASVLRVPNQMREFSF